MQRQLCSSLVFSSVLLLPVSASAQSIKITLPDSTTCTYATGAVTTDPATTGQLLATATRAPSGNCGGPPPTNPVSFGPGLPLTLTTAMPLPSNTNGESAAFTFQPVNATQCLGSITPSTGTAFTTSFCNSAASCQSVQNVRATFPQNTSTTTDATYSVSVGCTGPGSPTAVYAPTIPAAPQVTVQHIIPGGGCPIIASATPGIANFSQWTGTQSVDYFGGGLKSVDVTQFNSIYLGAWPGQYNTIASFPLPLEKYISAAFTPPATYFTSPRKPPNLFGKYTIAESQYTAQVSMTISTSCGDFSPSGSGGSTVVPGCSLNQGSSGVFFYWADSGTCVLTGGTQYFLNIINADISGITHGGGSATSTATQFCSGVACTDPIENGPGSWSGYVP